MFKQIWYSLGPVTKNLILINLTMFVVSALFMAKDIYLQGILGLHTFSSPLFKPYQLISHFFMHAPLGGGGVAHILFNMFALFMFGGQVERIWGGKKFLAFYLICAIAAALTQIGFYEWHIHQLVQDIPAPFSLDEVKDVVAQGKVFTSAPPAVNEIQMIMHTPMVGASGAVAGVVVAFALYYPNAELVIFPFPVPVKAKYLIPIYLLASLFMGTANVAGDNVAHFAHLGGAVIGFIIAYFWKKNQWRYR